MTDIFHALRNCLPPEIERSKVTPSTTFASLGFDSLDLIAFIVLVQERFDVEIPNQDLIEFRTFGDVENWLTDSAGMMPRALGG